MKYFTSDWHLGDDRIGINNKPNIMLRPFKSLREQHTTIIQGLKETLKDGDKLYHLGDVVYDKEYLSLLEHITQELFPNVEFILIVGNHDDNKFEDISPFFNRAYESNTINIGKHNVYLNHYPKKCYDFLKLETPFNGMLDDIDFALCGHIHSLWKVKRKIINVGVDVWNYKPVSEKQILFLHNAMKNFYDENVFLNQLK